MSKAEKKALKEYPQNIVTDYNGSHDLNYYKRVLYQQGYHQAEKDLELTWKDFEIIHKITYETSHDIALNNNGEISVKEFYREVLKRFKDYKEREEK